MAINQKVALEGIRFFAYHGYYPEEQLTGNEFILDILTEFEVQSDGNDDLINTVNYERLFEIATAEMKIPRKLLETVAHQILKNIQEEFSFVHTVEVSIRKMSLPLMGEVKNSLVQLTYKR